jgi:integrase
MSFSISYCVTAGAGVAGYIAGWGPPSVSPRAAAFAREVTARCGDLKGERAKSLLWAAGRLADYGLRLGLRPDPAVLLHPSVIERFAAHSPGLTPASRRTLRTNLRFIARRVVPHLAPPDAPLPRERAKPPYTPAEIAGFLALAAAQPTVGRRMRAAGLVCLGAGAGLTGAGLRAVRGTDVAIRSGGVVVQVRGSRPRPVPVLARYHQQLLASAEFAGGALLIGGRDPARRNVTYPLVSALSGGTGLPPLECSRLRSTWLAEAAQLIGLPAFMHAAGITCSQRLGDITATPGPGTEDQAVALLGGLSPGTR